MGDKYTEMDKVIYVYSLKDLKEVIGIFKGQIQASAKGPRVYSTIAKDETCNPKQIVLQDKESEEYWGGTLSIWKEVNLA